MTSLPPDNYVGTCYFLQDLNIYLIKIINPARHTKAHPTITPFIAALIIDSICIP